MSTKTFIVSGDSYTVPMMYPETPYAWPTFLAQKRGWDLINVAKGGGSNTHIFNSLVDAIEQNKEKDIIVFALWSESFRVNIFDIVCKILESDRGLLKQFDLGNKDASDFTDCTYAKETSRFTHVTIDSLRKKYSRDGDIPDIQHAYERAINFSLRQMWMMDQWCDLRNIEFYHGAAVSPFGDYTVIDTLNQYFEMEDLDENTHLQKAIERIEENNPYYKHLIESKNYMGFAFDGWRYINGNKLNISKADHHPNDAGHRRLSEIIDKFIDDGIKINIDEKEFNDGEYSKPRWKYSRPVYIYD